MAWQDRFREGSFRGVAFKTDASTVEGGRRKEDREFAKRDTGNSEDLGKKLKKFRLELLVIGDDYFQQRDALEEALETEGPGELVHPYRGTLTVQAGAYTLTETVGEGRLARFSVEFTLAGELKFPDQTEDDLAQATEDADKVKEESKSFFETLFSVANQPAFVVDSAADKVNAITDFAENAVKKVTDPVTNFAFAIRNIKTAVNDLIKAPGELAQRLQDAFDLLRGEFEDDPETAERIFGNFKDLGDDPAFAAVIGDTPARKVQGQNQNALLNVVKEITLANQAQAAVQVEFESTDSALKSRNAIVAGIDIQIGSAGDELYQSLKDLQTSLTKAIPSTGVTELLSIELSKTLPAIVIAYKNFEDLEKENEIIEQNNVEHPGFVPGGSTLLVSAG